MAEVYRQKVTALQSALYDPSIKDEAFELVRSLIDAVILVPENGKLRMDIKGDLVGILDLCADAEKKKPGTVSSAGLSEQLKVVAGARNPRQFTLPALPAIEV